MTQRDSLRKQFQEGDLIEKVKLVPKLIDVNLKVATSTADNIKTH